MKTLPIITAPLQSIPVQAAAPAHPAEWLAKWSRRINARISTLFRMERICYFKKSSQPDYEEKLVQSSYSFEFIEPSMEQLGPYLKPIETTFKIPAATVQQRYAQGCRVMLALNGGDLVAMLWMAYGSQAVSETGMTLHLQRDQFVTFNAVTRPDWRGQGISTAMNKLAYAHAARMRRVVQISWRSLKNRPALRVAEKLAQEPVGLTTCVWCLGRRIWCSHECRGDAQLLQLSNARH